MLLHAFRRKAPFRSLGRAIRDNYGKDKYLQVLSQLDAPTAGSEGDVLTRVLNDLQEREEIDEEMLKIVSESEEWKAYDDEVDDAIIWTRLHYYLNRTHTVTPQERSQMQAHCAALQEHIMHKHAEKLAEEFYDSMSEADHVRVKNILLALQRQQPNMFDPKPTPNLPNTLDDAIKAYQMDGMMMNYPGNEPSNEGDEQSSTVLSPTREVSSSDCKRR